MTTPQLPPLLPYPGDTAPDDVMKRYVDRVWLLRAAQREEAADLALATHRAALESAAQRQAAASEKHAAGTNAMVEHDVTAEARNRAALIVSSAVQIFVDRTSVSTGVTARPKILTDSVADAVALVNAALAAASAAG